MNFLRGTALVVLAWWVGWGAFRPPPAMGQDRVTGSACYVYGDRQTLNAARYIAISLAKRDALEKYPVFRDATATVQAAKLKNDIVTVVIARGMRQIKIKSETEDLAKAEICRTLEVNLKPEETKALIASVMAVERKRQGSPQTGLPETAALRVVRVTEGSCPGDFETPCLHIVVECRRNTFGERPPLRITWYDSEGEPAYSVKERVSCEAAGDIQNFRVRLPPRGYAFKVDLPRR